MPLRKVAFGTLTQTYKILISEVSFPVFFLGLYLTSRKREEITILQHFLWFFEWRLNETDWSSNKASMTFQNLKKIQIFGNFRFRFKRTVLYVQQRVRGISFNSFCRFLKLVKIRFLLKVQLCKFVIQL